MSRGDQCNDTVFRRQNRDAVLSPNPYARRRHNTRGDRADLNQVWHCGIRDDG
jgi:hypothetical protein